MQPDVEDTPQHEAPDETVADDADDSVHDTAPDPAPDPGKKIIWRTNLKQ